MSRNRQSSFIMKTTDRLSAWWYDFSQGVQMQAAHASIRMYRG
jgi:hypothetical protein